MDRKHKIPNLGVKDIMAQLKQYVQACDSVSASTKRLQKNLQPITIVQNTIIGEQIV
jgi:hypothetical protein